MKGLQQKSGHLNVGDLIEIISNDSFNGLTAECVESDGHYAFPYKCTVRLPEELRKYAHVVSENISSDALIYEEYWPSEYKIISKSITEN